MAQFLSVSRILRATSSPVRPGISMSSTATCGASRAKISSASLPFFASYRQIRSPRYFCKVRHSTLRSINSSSATSNLHFTRASPPFLPTAASAGVQTAPPCHDLRGCSLHFTARDRASDAAEILPRPMLRPVCSLCAILVCTASNSSGVIPLPLSATVSTSTLPCASMPAAGCVHLP